MVNVVGEVIVGVGGKVREMDVKSVNIFAFLYARKSSGVNLITFRTGGILLTPEVYQLNG